MLSDELTKILDKQAPVKEFLVRSNYAPWLSKTTKKLIKQMDLDQKKASETNETNEWKVYERFRNRINNILKQKRKPFRREKLNDEEDDVARSWKAVKSCIWYKGSPPTKQVFFSISLAECMNCFFTSRMRNL